MSDTLNLALLQTDIVWENKHANFRKVEQLLAKNTEPTDVVVLPEMFSTGFSMNSKQLSEPGDGETLQWLKKLSQKYNVALAGSFIAGENEKCYNRGFFITPQDTQFYNKRHLFRMGGEHKHFAAGSKQLIASFRGFNIGLIVCYDLRFPVWIRNVNNRYDLLICVANWPQPRAKVWNTLLQARAIENVAYVCGVNRVGTDGIGLNYIGQSQVIDFKGNVIADSGASECLAHVQISRSALQKFRQKFPVWQDADAFDIMP